MLTENPTDSLSGDTPNLPQEPVEAAPSTTTEIIEETPSATKNAGGGSAPDLSPESVGAASSVTPGIKKGHASGLSQTTAKVTQPASEDTGKHTECRREPRIHVRWHASALIDGQDAYHGFIKDISLNGADVFLGHSLQNEKFVKLHICLPPLSVTDDPHVVEVSGKIVCVVYDCNESFFRTGVNFLKFNLESDQAHLKSRILPRGSAAMGL